MSIEKNKTNKTEADYAHSLLRRKNQNKTLDYYSKTVQRRLSIIKAIGHDISKHEMNSSQSETFCDSSEYVSDISCKSNKHDLRSNINLMYPKNVQLDKKVEEPIVLSIIDAEPHRSYSTTSTAIEDDIDNPLNEKFNDSFTESDYPTSSNNSCNNIHKDDISLKNAAESESIPITDSKEKDLSSKNSNSVEPINTEISCYKKNKQAMTPEFKKSKLQLRNPVVKNVFDEILPQVVGNPMSLTKEIQELEAEMEQWSEIPFNLGTNKILRTPKCSDSNSLEFTTPVEHYTTEKKVSSENMETQVFSNKMQDSDTTSIDFKSATDNYCKSPNEELFSSCATNEQCRKRNKRNSAISFIRRNTISLLENIQIPKQWLPRRADLESTRKPEALISQKHPLGNSQIDSMISTLTIANSPNSMNDFIKEGSVPTVVENFLENALGSELFNSTGTNGRGSYYSMHENNDLSINVSPIKNVMSHKFEMREKHSYKLNRTLTIYKSLTQRIKKKFRKSIVEEKLPWTHELLSKDINPNLKDDIQQLLQQIDIQQTLIYQASKALILCNSMKEFTSSLERVESERLLLLSHLRKNACTEEIRRLVDEVHSYDFHFNEKAKIIIKDISLALKEGSVRLARQNGDFVDWYVVIFVQGSTVWATQAVPCPIAASRIYFSGAVILSDLKPNFIISVKIYNMKLPHTTFTHDDKYRIYREKNDSSVCPSAKDLLGRGDKSLTLKQCDFRFITVKETSFNLCGTTDLMVQNINIISSLPLRCLPRGSILEGTIDLNMKCQLDLPAAQHSGFLTYGEATGECVSWNRCWCIFDVHQLLFWNYPEEQEFKEPLMVIDLYDCLSRRVSIVDRTICARPKTLIVETTRKKYVLEKEGHLDYQSNYQIVRNLLSCDTYEEMMEWQTKLNHVIVALREWNLIKSRYDTEISDM